MNAQVAQHHKSGAISMPDDEPEVIEIGPPDPATGLPTIPGDIDRDGPPKFEA